LQKVETYGVDGVMIGRAIFGNFWFFDRERSEAGMPLVEKLHMFAEHADLFEKCFAGMRSVVTLRKHVRGLAQGFPGAKELREKLVQATTAVEIREIVEAEVVKAVEPSG
jgi:tRNA-dihydrouridine synthase